MQAHLFLSLPVYVCVQKFYVTFWLHLSGRMFESSIYLCIYISVWALDAFMEKKIKRESKVVEGRQRHVA